MKIVIKSFFLFFTMCFAGDAYAGPASAKLSALADMLLTGYVAKAGPSKATLAVFPFNCEEKLEKQRVGFAVSEVMSHRFVADSAFTVVERGELGRLLSEQKLQASGVVDNDTAVRLGRILGADVILIGNIQKAGGKYQINARLVNAETSEVFSSGFQELDSDTFEEDAGVYLNLVPEEQTLGIYIIYNHRSNSNKTPTVLEPASGIGAPNATLTRESVPFISNLAGGGLIYRPARNIQINGEVTTAIKETKYSSTQYSAGFTLESKLKMTTVSLMASYIARPLGRWGCWAGLGLQGIDITANSSVRKKENPPIGLFIKSGFEFKLQSRIGLGVNLKYDLRKVAMYSQYDNKVFELNPLSLESTITLYF